MGIFHAMNMTMANTCTRAVFFLGWLYLSNGDYTELPVCLLFVWLVVRLFSEFIPLPGSEDYIVNLVNIHKMKRCFHI